MQPNTVRELFDRALDMPASDRGAFLHDACAGDLNLHASVEGLLLAHERAGGFLSDPVVTAERLFPIGELSAGERVGKYTLLRMIGEGGCGTVYEAGEDAPLRRRVALKVIKAGMDTRQVIARFGREREALAMMEHPNIARVLDAGATDGGRPFFVMELVDGRPLVEHCRSARLDVRQRLALFVAVCQAVQHAHQKGIIHRDLKPGNVLVAEHDGKLIPKVIDFGIAKALNGTPLEMTQVTGPSQVLGTLPYISPEQAQDSGPLRSGTDIDTRSDIYSLGVVLYELLADAPPFDPARLRTVSYDQMRRIIREEDPPPPSHRLSAMSRELPDADAARRAEMRHRAQEVRGEPDWIVLKAMEKDRDRRYATAESLAADVERYLRYEAVSAGPPTKLYRFRKFARRNRRELLTAGVICLAIAAGLASSLVSLVRARHSAAAEALAHRLADQQAARAEAGEKKAKEELEQVRDGQRAAFRLLEPEKGIRADTYRNVLDFITSRVDDGRLRDFPTSELPVRTALGQGYQDLRQWPEAAAQFRRGADLVARLYGPESLDVVPKTGSWGGA